MTKNNVQKKMKTVPFNMTTISESIKDEETIFLAVCLNHTVVPLMNVFKVYVNI